MAHSEEREKNNSQSMCHFKNLLSILVLISRALLFHRPDSVGYLVKVSITDSGIRFGIVCLSSLPWFPLVTSCGFIICEMPQFYQATIVDVLTDFLERVNKEFSCHTVELINVFIQEQILEISFGCTKRIYATHVR